MLVNLYTLILFRKNISVIFAKIGVSYIQFSTSTHFQKQQNSIKIFCNKAWVLYKMSKIEVNTKLPLHDLFRVLVHYYISIWGDLLRDSVQALPIVRFISSSPSSYICFIMSIRPALGSLLSSTLGLKWKSNERSFF